MSSKSSKHHIYLAFCSNDANPNPKFSNWIGRFDPSDNTFSYVTSIPQLAHNHMLKDFAIASINDSIYMIGGRICRKDNKNSTIEVEARATLMCYNIGTDQWSVCAPLSHPRFNFACTVLNNKIYIAGGQYELASAKCTSSVEMYDPTDDKWTQLPNMMRLRYKSVGVAWQGKVYIVGGFVQGCDGDCQLGYVDRCSAEVYDGKGKWDLVPGMWKLDVPPNQIVAMEGRLFSSGDCLNTWKGHVELYDENINLWNVLEGSQLNHFMTNVLESDRQSMQRLYVTMAPINTYLYFLAGYRDTTSSRTILTVHRFDTVAKEDGWMSFAPSLGEEGEQQLCAHCCVAPNLA
ncbi:hypothetical protein SASPL_121282 [Salvia splendens]|uniref:Uncharacterized protein n=2 Tax=Salvia splendens TaxID=180675 RepID=A0A8X8XW66_SALSN|nr:hypothetical protein SASPL_121282 [Salvia splendens]